MALRPGLARQRELRRDGREASPCLVHCLRRGLSAYGCYGLHEDPYDVPEAYWHSPLVYRAGGPTETGAVVLRLRVDDNDFNPDWDEDPESRVCESDDAELVHDVTIWVLEVASLYWENYSDNNDLDGCPNNGGMRIFPEKKTPGDTANYRNKVNLKVTLSNPVPQGKTVYVHAFLFDVDDPKYTGSPVDPETPVAYNDNQCNDRTAQGSDRGANFNYAGLYNKWYIFNAGEDEKSQVVSIDDCRPGNNWKAVASTRNLNGWVDGVHLATDGQTFVDASFEPVPAQCISPMLTVWRTLHVEFDTMEAPPEDGSEPFGEVEARADDVTKAGAFLTTNPGWRHNVLEGAVLDPDGTTAGIAAAYPREQDKTWEVSYNFVDQQSGVALVVVNTDYTADLFDNDGVNGGQGEVDAGEIWEMTEAGPGLNRLIEFNTDDPKWLTDLNPPATNDIITALNAYFDDAYIRCVAVPEGENGNAHPTFGPFVRNGYRAFANTRDIPVHGADLWCVDVNWCYESRTQEGRFAQPCASHNMRSYAGDDDPEYEAIPGKAGVTVPPGAFTCTTGTANATPGWVADLYVECLREGGWPAAPDVAHEIGHLLGLKHAEYQGEFGENDKGLMGWEKPELLCEHDWALQEPWEHEENRFSYNNVAFLRSLADPWNP